MPIERVCRFCIAIGNSSVRARQRALVAAWMSYVDAHVLTLRDGTTVAGQVNLLETSAPNGSEDMPPESTRLITLGTKAGPFPRAHRAQSSNLLIVNETPYVIDAGDGAARRLAKAGINARDIGTIFITHHHDDHTAGLGTLMSVAWDLRRTRPIHVYGPPRTEDLVNAAVQFFTISAEIRISDGGLTVPIADVFFGHDVDVGVIYEDSNIKVTAVENTHFAFHRGPAADKHKSYSYRSLSR